MLKNLFRFRNLHRTHNADKTTRSIEGVLESDSRRIGAIDPETEKQWNRLEMVLKRKENMSPTPRSVFPRWQLRPAVSFTLAVVLVAIAGLLWFRHPSIKTYETKRSQHSTITLPDSSEVVLNSLSELSMNRWPLQRTRLVSLKGEAFFRIQRNGTPFIITTDVGTVQVLGTQFNIRVRDGRMEVAVLSGSVRISVLQNGKDSSVILSKGQIALCKKGEYPETPGSLPFSEYPGWMHGKFLFYRTSILSACREIESQFDIVLSIEQTSLENETITGMVDSHSVETALTTLAQLTGKRIRHEDSGYILY